MSNKKEILVVINPRLLKKIPSDLYKDISLLSPSNHVDGVEKTRAAIKSGIKKFIVFGGDGTLNSIANGLLDHDRMPIAQDIELWVAGGGTGNDYIKSVRERMGLKPFGKPDLGKIFKEALTPEANRSIKSVYTDLGLAEISTPKSSWHAFLNMAGPGLSGKVVYDKAAMESFLPKSMAYSIPSLKNLISYPPIPIKLEWFDGKSSTGHKTPLELSSRGIFISKGKYAGGGMQLGSETVMDDGCLALTVIPDLSFFKLMKGLALAVGGKAPDIPGAIKIKAQKVILETQLPWEIECDGEYLGHITKASFRVIRNALKIATA